MKLSRQFTFFENLKHCLRQTAKHGTRLALAQRFPQSRLRQQISVPGTGFFSASCISGSRNAFSGLSGKLRRCDWNAVVPSGLQSRTGEVGCQQLPPPLV